MLILLHHVAFLISSDVLFRYVELLAESQSPFAPIAKLTMQSKTILLVCAYVLYLLSFCFLQAMLFPSFKGSIFCSALK
jgi:hypothetical protein